MVVAAFTVTGGSAGAAACSQNARARRGAASEASPAAGPLPYLSARARSLRTSAFIAGAGPLSGGSLVASRPRRFHAQVTRAGRIETTEKWWEKEPAPNMRDIHSTSEFIDALANAGEKLVIVDFYAGWCGACKALYPKLCKLMVQNDDIIFLKVNFEENKPMCKSLGVKVLPFFHFYRGADGKLTSFSASISRFQRLRDAIAEHNTPRCSLGEPPEIPELAAQTETGDKGKEKETTGV